MPVSKPWYLSKAILLNIFMGIAMIVGVFIPSVADFIKAYFGELGSGWALLNIVVRLITKQEIS